MESKTEHNTLQPTSGLYTKALLFATEKHAGQKRNSYGVDYICHCVGVATNVRRSRCFDEEILAAALLHDTLEDTATTYEELVEKFGKKVADLVKELTNDDKRKKELGKVKYTEEKFEQMTDEAVFIKLCDMHDNLADTNNCFGNPNELLKRLNIATALIKKRNGRFDKKVNSWIDEILNVIRREIENTIN